MTSTETRTVVAQAHAAIEAAKAGYLKHAETAKADTAAARHAHRDFRGNVSARDGARLDVQHSDQLRKFVDNDAVRTMNAGVDAVRARRDQAQARAAEVRASLIKPGDAAQESRNTRYWNRAKSLLDDAGTGTVTIDLAQKLIASASTREELSVLIEELPTYLDVHRPTGLTAKQRETYERGITAAVEHTVNNSVPEYAQAVRNLIKWDRAVTVTEANAAHVRDAITSGTVAPMIISDPADYDPDR